MGHEGRRGVRRGELATLTVPLPGLYGSRRHVADDECPDPIASGHKGVA